MGGDFFPILTAILSNPQGAGGRIHGKPLAALIHIETLAIDKVITIPFRQSVRERIKTATAITRPVDDKPFQDLEDGPHARVPTRRGQHRLTRSSVYRHFEKRKHRYDAPAPKGIGIGR